MRSIRYANLFYKVTHIHSTHCFEYNNAIVFAVPRVFVSRAIGENNKYLEILNNIIGKKIKIVAIPHGREDIENFVATITRPVRFKAIEIRGEDAIISAGAQSKASLIGKNRSRLNEMENILGQYFGIKKVLVR
mgnify:CR=1 FL=1